MAKTKPIGVRFDEELLKKMKDAEVAKSPQKALNYFEQLFLDTHDAAMGRIGLTGTLPTYTISPAANKLIEKTLVEIYPKQTKELIEKQIAAIKTEKIPEVRNTTYGRKIWANEQASKIVELEAILK